MLTAQPQLKRWTKAEYYRVGETGIFQGQHVELVEGEIVQLPPKTEPHSQMLMLANEALRPAFLAGHVIRIHMPMNLGDATEPEPDILVVEGTPRTVRPHPRSADLIVEISESSGLDYDRGRKASLYAKHGIQDYWIINLVDNQLEVHRKPIADAEEPFGFRYEQVMLLRPGSFVRPLAAARSKIAVAELLP